MVIRLMSFNQLSYVPHVKNKCSQNKSKFENISPTVNEPKP